MSVITYYDAKTKLPERKSFLDPQQVEQQNILIDNRKEILFLPTYLWETHLQKIKYQKAEYAIVLMGILRDGRRVNVILDGIEPYFEIKIPDDIPQNEFITKITNILSDNESTKPCRMSTVTGKTFKYYQPKQSKFLRLYYKKTKNRVDAIKLVRNKNYQTTADDLASYYRVVCRDWLTTFSSWAVLNNYQTTTHDSLKGDTFTLNIKDYVAYTGELVGDLLKDKTLSVCWDIETWSPTGDIPKPENPTDKIFCLSMTYQWVNDKEPFYKVCFCDYPANAKPSYTTVVCGNEVNIIKAFAECFNKMKPEFIFGFNDSDYDWNWVIKRAANTKGLLIYLAERFDCSKPFIPYTDKSVIQYSFKAERVKIEATTYAEGSALMMNGYIPVDVRTIFRKLYPTAEQSSLKFFLSKNKLGSKDDMPYERLMRIYNEYNKLVEKVGWDTSGKELEFNFKELNQLSTEEKIAYNRLKDEMADINKYCIVDAQRCHDLVKIRSVIMDHREVSNLSYVSVSDAFYRANGMKVRNLTIAKGQKHPFNIRFSNITNMSSEEGKYPGAFVFPPRKGLKISKLSIEERIKKASITKEKKIPACQEWLNTNEDEVKKFYDIISNHGATMTEDQITEIEKDIGKLPKKFKDFLIEPTGRPITGLDFSSLYPSLIRAYNFSPEYCILDKKIAREVNETGQKITKVDFNFNGVRRVGYFIWHNNQLSPYRDVDGKQVPNEQFQFGVYPYILDELFNKRAVLKKQMKKFDHEKEEMEAKGDAYIKQHSEEYEDICFNKNYLNSKQNALKVFMNTFYGEAGNKLSPFFVLEVAGGITTYGIKNIKMAFEFVKSKGCQVYYGDSVAEYTPILIKHDGKFIYCEIKDLTSGYIQYNNNKEIAILDNYQIWSDIGWTKIKHIIRHKTNKKMYRVVTRDSVVDVTEDHSLLDENSQIIKPSDVLGKKVLTSVAPLYKSEDSLSDKNLAWVFGLFAANGQCDNTNWYINANEELLSRAKEYLEFVYTDKKWIVLKDNDIYRLESSGRKNELINWITQWKNMCYYNKSKIVPNKILGSNKEIQMQFLKGYTQGQKINKIKFTSQISAFSFYQLLKNVGYLVELTVDQRDIYLSLTENNNNQTVLNVIELPQVEQYVYDFETENHHFAAGVGNLILHNTDSLYLSVPEKEFIALDKSYYSGKTLKLDYWTQLVTQTFAAIKPLNQEVNDMFVKDNGTKFLSMAYEEALYPVAFTAKKKYFGIAHENIPNFKPKDLFIRGLEVKKRGVSDLLRTIFNEIMWMCMSPENIYELIELVQDKIDDIYHRKWEMKDFIQTDVYRPSKKNVKVQTFVARMKERGMDIKPNERFNYVIIKKYPYQYDIRGRKESLGVGDKIELAEYAQSMNLDIDLDHYMQSSINGQLGRLVTYHEMFHVDPLDNTPEELKTAEDKIYKNACKFIDEYCKQYYASYNTFGKTYQKIFKTANKYIGGRVKEIDPLASDLLSANVDIKNFEEWIIIMAEKAAIKIVDNYGQVYIDNELKKCQTADEKNQKLTLLQKIYYGIPRKSILDVRTNAFKETMSILQRKIRENLSDITKLYHVYHNGVQRIIDDVKKELKLNDDLYKPVKSENIREFTFDDFNTPLNDEKLEKEATEITQQIFNDQHVIDILNKFKTLYNDILSAYLVIKRTDSIVTYLKLKRNKQTRIIVRPDDDVIKNIIEKDVQDLVKENTIEF